jgi:Holliday junction resolvase
VCSVAEREYIMQRESQIQAAILNYLRSLGWWCWAVKAAVCNERGVPDVLCCYKGRFVAFEIKTQKGKLSGPQKIQILRIHRAGGRASMVRSIDEVKKILQEIDTEENGV